MDYNEHRPFGGLQGTLGFHTRAGSVLGNGLGPILIMQYEWTRFWCLSTESFQLDLGGFLLDPEADYGRTANASTHTLDSLSDTPCLVLLGEPGIGKTTAIADQLSREQEQTSQRRQLMRLDLSSYGDESRLIADLFESDEMNNWVYGEHSLQLYLDSIDECRLQIPHVAKILSDRFDKLRPTLDRLKLRIACRTVEWPNPLTRKFQELWGDGGAAIYELLPLRRKDILTAAHRHGIDAEAFLVEVVRCNAQPFAIKPITLEFLLRIFREQGAFPATQYELYDAGCRQLVSELNESRISAAQLGQLDSSERLRAAETIAAVTQLCNKSAVYIGPFSDVVSTDEFSLQDITALESPGNSRSFSEEQLREALSTGLFSGRGNNRIGFSHRTYAEFLAASFVLKSPLNTTERLKIVRHADDSSGKVIPQLAETAAWIASQDSDICLDLLKTDPQVLVRSDCASLSPETKRDLLAQLLKLAANDQLMTHDWRQRDHYHNLEHPSIALQLRPVITDPSQAESAREFALVVTEECAVSALQDELCSIALDSNDCSRSRYLAARALLNCADADTQLRLKPLAIGQPEQDPEMRIRALVLNHLWPDKISAQELFSSLRVPASDRGGSYGFFLSHELTESMSTADLPYALDWASRLNEAELREFSVRPLVAVIAQQGFDHLDETAVFAAFTKYSLAVLKTHNDLLPESSVASDADEPRRRSLLEAIVPEIEDFDRQGYGLIFRAPRLARTSDTVWMIDRLRQAETSTVCLHWAKLIEHLFDPTEPGLLDVVIEACRWCEPLRKVFSDRFAPVGLDSERARQLRERYNQHLEWERERENRKNPPLLNPPPMERVHLALEASESGNATAWYHASHDLQLEATSTRYEGDLRVDVTETPGWKIADTDTRLRLLRAAERFLLECEPHADEWLGTNSTLYHALWGYKALLVLRKEASVTFERLPVSVWATWAPIVVSYSDFGVKQRDKALHDEIACICGETAPDAATDSLRVIFRKSEGLFVLPQFVERAWSDPVERCLCEEVSRAEAKPNVIGRLLDALLDRDCIEARKIALSIARDSGRSLECRLEAATALLSHVSPDDWEALWEWIRGDEAFGKRLLLRHAHKHMHNPVLATQLSEESVADLYIWLEQSFPAVTDPKHDGAHLVSPRDAIGEYRDASLRALQHRATPAAIEVLGRIHEELAHLDWMPRVITSAKQTLLRETWKPLTPSELLTVTSTNNQCLVRSAATLQVVVLESLENLQKSLHGETPAVVDLWDEQTTGKYRPKDENDLSNYVKRHLVNDLQSRGIVSLREVEIRRGRGATPGERTDIHITGVVPTISPGVFDQVRVIVEVKGVWHREVESAMETQLAKRYLWENTCCHGIYLVGWYMCSQWDEEDNRRSRSCGRSLKEFAQKLREQADELSSDSMYIKSFVLDASLG